MWRKQVWILTQVARSGRACLSHADGLNCRVFYAGAARA